MTEPIYPPALREGDTIGIISPASPMIRERLEKGVAYLKDRGFSVVLGRHVYDQHGYLAGTDEARLEDIHAMFANPEVKAIISSRGGYGTPRLVPFLDYALIRKHPKILVGYSDLTSLQLAIYSQTGLVTYSGPMAAVEMGKGIDPFTEEHFWPHLLAGQFYSEYPAVPESPLVRVHPGKARGTLLGGCLSMINPILGTPYQPDFRGAILILEDVGEEPYRVDRYLSHYRSAGILQQVAGIIFSQFVDCNPGDDPSLTIDEVIEDYTAGLEIPVVKNFLYGHLDRKFTVPIGATVELDADALSIRFIRPKANGMV
ncbi:MAG: LD-carboxypeptidase [Calditrichaeota bacterium]|nr:LD-carboxypeptidase [Calditrichota bacterium]